MKGNEAENLLRDMQEYSRLKDRVKNIFGGTMTLKDVVDSIERVSKLQKSNPFNARVLTYDEAVMWNEYRKIGTPEECRTAVEKQKAKTPDFEADGSHGDYDEIVYDTWICPGCGEHYEIDHGRYEYCPCCGQKLSWENHDVTK